MGKANESKEMFFFAEQYLDNNGYLLNGHTQFNVFTMYKLTGHKFKRPSLKNISTEKKNFYLPSHDVIEIPNKYILAV